MSSETTIFFVNIVKGLLYNIRLFLVLWFPQKIFGAPNYLPKNIKMANNRKSIWLRPKMLSVLDSPSSKMLEFTLQSPFYLNNNL